MIHRNIEDYFEQRGYYYDRRKNFYKNQRKARTRIVTIPYLAQSVASILLCRPSDARARPSSLLKKDSDYKSIFGADYSMAAYLGCFSLMRSVESYLKTESGGMPANERKDMKFHVALYVAALLAGRPKPSPEDVASDHFVDVPPEVFADALTSVRDVVEEIRSSGGGTLDSDRIAKSPDLTKKLLAKLEARFDPSSEGDGHSSP